MKITEIKDIYCWDRFKELFGSVEFSIPKKLKLYSKKLKRNMVDKDILEEFKPQEATLGELVYALDNFCKKDDGYIFYIRDESKTLWAVIAFWSADYRKWCVSASSVSDPDGWRAGRQVVSRKFGSGKLGSLGSSGETSGIYKLNERVSELEAFKQKVEKVLNLEQ